MWVKLGCVKCMWSNPIADHEKILKCRQDKISLLLVNIFQRKDQFPYAANKKEWTAIIFHKFQASFKDDVLVAVACVGCLFTEVLACACDSLLQLADRSHFRLK